MPGQNLTKLPERNLDVLRATAVLLVLTGHLLMVLDLRLPFVSVWTLGHAGVLLFFVHTSLVLMSSIERNGVSGKWVRHFYLRRAFRIYPLAIVVVLLSALLRLPPHAVPITEANPSVPPTFTTLFANLTLTQNLFVDGRDIQGVLWSLPLELQMYLVLPVAFLFARRSVRGTLVLFGLCIVAALAFPRMSEMIPGTWRLNVITYSPYFMFGVLCYSVLHAGYKMPQLAKSWFTSFAKTICTYSYGIYLLHVPILWLAFTVLHAAPSIVQWATFGSLLVALPYIAYRSIEEPGIAFGRRLVHGSRIRIAEVAAP